MIILGLMYIFSAFVQRTENVLFGEIVNQEMVLNNAGSMITNIWNELPQRFPNIELIENVIMPNHIHCIIAIVGVPLVGTQKTEMSCARIDQVRENSGLK